MEILDFRSYMIERVRAFDKWAWIDIKDNPLDYEGYDFNDWYNLFKTFVEDNNV